MEAGRSLLSSPPPIPNHPRTHQLRGPLSSTSVSMLHDQASRAVTSVPTTSTVGHFPASVLSQEHREDCRTYVIKEEKMAQVTLLDRQHLNGRLPFCQEKEKYELDQCLKYFEQRLLYPPGLWYYFPIPCIKEKPLLFLYMKSIINDNDIVVDNKSIQMEKSISNSVKPGDVLALAKRAMMASRKAASLAEKKYVIADEFDESHFLSLGPHGSTKNIQIKEETKVRSRRLLDRQSKKRKVPKKANNVEYEVYISTDTDIVKKIDKGLDSNDPLRLFFRGPETKQLLTAKEEKDLFIQIEDLTRLTEVKQRLQLQFNRDPTLAEWAQAVGMSCHTLQSCLYSGKRSREKMIYANFRLVVHVAKQYEGKGLNIQDLLQEGSRGLMKSVEKFKPKVGCRFPTYAYWWIRQSIRKAIFQNSRTIRLPENVFAILKRIKNARRYYIQEGHLPTNEDLAKHVGISTEKLESLLRTTRNPISIQDCPWVDQNVSYQEITADPEVETPDLCIAKQLMRQHVRNLLGILSPRERRIIQLRFGIQDKKRKTLTEIGVIFGLTKERVRQLEIRAFDKLKGCLKSQGLEAYVDLLI